MSWEAQLSLPIVSYDGTVLAVTGPGLILRDTTDLDQWMGLGPGSLLREFMGHISSKTLTQRLRLLEEMGFVQRRAFLEIPPRVEYHLTEKGQEFGEVIAAIEQFAQKKLSGLVEAVTAEKPR